MGDFNLWGGVYRNSQAHTRVSSRLSALCRPPLGLWSIKRWKWNKWKHFQAPGRLSCPFVQHISRCSDTTRVNECRVFQRGHLALTGAAVTWRWQPHLSSPPRWHPQSVISLFFPPRVTNTIAHVFFSAWLISVFICFLKNVANGRAVSSAQKRDGLLVGELSCLLPLSFLPVVSTAVNLQRDNFMGSAPYREESET